VEDRDLDIDLDDRNSTNIDLTFNILSLIDINIVVTEFMLVEILFGNKSVFECG